MPKPIYMYEGALHLGDPQRQRKKQINLSSGTRFESASPLIT